MNLGVTDAHEDLKLQRVIKNTALYKVLDDLLNEEIEKEENALMSEAEVDEIRKSFMEVIQEKLKHNTQSSFHISGNVSSFNVFPDDDNPLLSVSNLDIDHAQVDVSIRMNPNDIKMNDLSLVSYGVYVDK
eukprot:TRINITY_DN917_c0_g1_i1.p1 TRINITY_DN917_c0_g1~~TRINITY_DN917_c0_g1_i1.p1  ORF type:complete len:131 (-),score=41.95 TRINITY_DN917_c0_g1_i1:267-659(-)